MIVTEIVIVINYFLLQQVLVNERTRFTLNMDNSINIQLILVLKLQA